MLSPRLVVVLVLVTSSSGRQLLSVTEDTEVSSTPLPSYDSATTPLPETKCYAEEEAVKLCKANGETSEEVEVDSEIRDWNDEENTKSYKKYISLKDRNRVLLERRLYTDCTFVVGPDNNTQEFQAHRAQLVAASPVFQSLLRDHEGRVLRMRDFSPKAFKSLLEFVYTGGVCLTSFSEACELVGVAARLQVDQLARQSRAFLWSSLHPGNVWQALQCAHRYRDYHLEHAAMQMIKDETEKSLMDPQFVEIPQSSLVSLLQQHTLSVSSELVLFEASLRWAMAEAKRRDLPQEPDGLRIALGPVLGLIRFLNLTPRQFTDLQSTSKILNYPESLAVIFNINSPGVMELPANLSSSTEKRKIPDSQSYFDVFEDTNSMACNVKRKVDDNYLDGITTSKIHNNGYQVNLIGIQIPKRKVVPCNLRYMEDLTVQILNDANEVFHSMDFKERIIDSCFTNILNLKFKMTIIIPSENSYHGQPSKLRIVFRKSGRYPKSLGSGSITYGNQYGQVLFMDTLGYSWKFGANAFIYSMITE